METVEIPNKKRKVGQIYSNGNDRDFKQKAKLHSRDKKSTISLRKQFIAPSCEYYYPEDPLKIVRGEGTYLFNEKGVKYLDCVNNVCHVFTTGEVRGFEGSKSLPYKK